MTAQCKYSLDRMKQIVADKGIVNAIDEINSSAIDDGQIRRLWRLVEDSYVELEELLLSPG